MFRISRMTCAAAFAGVALTLAGCGGGSDGGSEGEETKSKGLSSLSADELFDKAKDELEGADSFTISGEVEDEEDGPVEMDLTFAKSGDLYGTIGLDGADVEMRVLGDRLYMNASNEFWALIGEEEGEDEETISGMQAMMGNKWIVMDSADADEGLDEFNRASMLEEFEPEGDVSIGDTKKIDGIECIALNDSTGTLWVDSKTGRPVQIVSTEDNATARITYDEGDAPEAPADALDISALGAA